jgi:chemotaxis protein MotB
MDAAKVLRVLGLASTQNLNKADPFDPENRRISIIVLNSRSEHAMMRDDSTTTTLSNDAATGVNPLAQRFEPTLVKPAAGAGGNSMAATLSGAAAGVKPPAPRLPAQSLPAQRLPAQRLEPPILKPPAGAALEQ